MSDFPSFTEAQLNKIAVETPAPCLESACEQWEGDDPSELAGLAVRWSRINECWEEFVRSRTNENLHLFWSAQAKLNQWHRGFDPIWWRSMTQSALGVFPGAAERVRLTPEAKKGLRALRDSERDLVLQFKMR